ncbi:MAG: hypothetical protein JXR60_07780 [Bacteroidales bacterium]|nr:hypothetical protein [Bacteroidales bacterium]
MKTFSQTISAILHPAFVPLLGFLLLYYISGDALYLPPNIFWFTLLIIFQFTILIPFSILYFLYRIKKVSDFYLSKREERPLPLILTLISYAISYAIFRYFHYPHIIVSFFATVVIATAFSMFVSFTYKISLHSIAWGAVSGLCLALAYRYHIELHFIVSISFIISAIVALSRLFLDAHKPAEIYTGWASSFSLALYIMTFF